MTDLNLPDDLITFLKVGRQLEYDPTACEAGAVTLVSVNQLKVELFPMDSLDTEIIDEDPHQYEGGCYLVEGVNLVAACTGGYKPVGLLLWLPHDGQYATWDDSHYVIRVFGPEVSWSQIALSPTQHINAQWDGRDDESASIECLKPWRLHPYNAEQVADPLPDLAEWYEASWTMRGAYQCGICTRIPEQIHIRLVRDGDRCQITGQYTDIDAGEAWQPEPHAFWPLKADEWDAARHRLEAGFWHQPDESGCDVDETETMWEIKGFRDRSYHTTFRSFAAGRCEGDAVHELGAHLAKLAGIDRFEVKG